MVQTETTYLLQEGTLHLQNWLQCSAISWYAYSKNFQLRIKNFLFCLREKTVKQGPNINQQPLTNAAHILSTNSPIVCAVLALDSWNYCSEEQAQHMQDWPIFFIQLNYVHNNKEIICCHLMLNSPATRWHWGFHFLNQWSHARQILRRRCWAVGPGLQSNSSNCLVLIPHRQLGTYLLSTGESYGPTAPHMQDWI